MKAMQIGTKRFNLAVMFCQGFSTSSAFSQLRPLVERQQEPWIFTSNAPGGRVPDSMPDQIIKLQHEINRAYKEFGKVDRDELEDEIKRAESGRKPDRKPREPKPVPATPDNSNPLPEAKGKDEKSPMGQKRRFFSEWKRLRSAIEDSVARTGAIAVDSLDTMRPVISARKLIEAGISADHLIGVMCLHWPEASRQQYSIQTPDFSSIVEPIEGTDKDGATFHHLAGYVRTLMLARENVMLIGAAGTGKSRIMRQVAATIQTEAHPDGLPYGETPMTPGATRGDLLGRHTIEGFVESDFVRIYRDGGVFNFEEIDASDPSMLIVVNNALASNELHNPVNGEIVIRHGDFIAGATANTMGFGADSKYVGREKLDLATIDRFRIGRTLVTLDESLAESLMMD